jgi:hypothetical protein
MLHVGLMWSDGTGMMGLLRAQLPLCRRCCCPAATAAAAPLPPLLLLLLLLPPILSLTTAASGRASAAEGCHVGWALHLGSAAGVVRRVQPPWAEVPPQASAAAVAGLAVVARRAK